MSPCSQEPPLASLREDNMGTQRGSRTCRCCVSRARYLPRAWTVLWAARGGGGGWLQATFPEHPLCSVLSVGLTKRGLQLGPVYRPLHLQKGFLKLKLVGDIKGKKKRTGFFFKLLSLKTTKTWKKVCPEPQWLQ